MSFIQSQQEEIHGALARGYCSKENEHKALDPELIKAMAKEVDSLIYQVVQNTLSEVERRVEADRQDPDANEVTDHFIADDAYESKVEAFFYGYNQALTQVQSIIKDINKEV